MAGPYIATKWFSPKVPLTPMGLYLVVMKVYETPGWLDGVVWTFFAIFSVGVLAVNYHAKFVDPVIKE